MSKKSLDVIGQLEDDLKANPLDYAKWSRLIKQVVSKDKEEQVRSVFEKYLTIFKLDGAQWCNYINYELNRGDFKRVQQLFAKCLPLTTHVELCRLYVSYVRRINDVITGGEKARGTVIQAFEFAVNKVGNDVCSSDLWNDYIEFLKSWTPAASWEQQQKVDLIRKVYKRCLVIPTEKIESMWSAYTKWENEVNSATASRFIAETSTEFMEARSWNTEWHNITKRLLKRQIVPYTLTDSQQNLVLDQLQLWYNWLELEKKNSLNLKENSAVQARIEYVYRQATTTLPFVSEIWFKLTKFLLGSNEDSNLSKCIEVAEDACGLNPKSFLLVFQLSELYEKDNNYNKASEVLNNLINHLMKQEGPIYDQIQEITKLTETKKVVHEDDDMEEDTPMTVMNISERDATKLIQLEDKQAELCDLITIVYVKLMMLSKRSQGIKEARNIFKQARDNYERLGWQIYTENALMEYYSDKQKTAEKVFKLGMKVFSNNGKFLVSYLDFLILTNAVESIKVFFESAITALLKEVTGDKELLIRPELDTYRRQTKTKRVETNESFIRKIIKAYIKFAVNYLDIDTVKSLENRYEQYFPEDDALDFFAERYTTFDLNVIQKYDLAHRKEEVVEEVEVPKKKRKVQKQENYTPEVEENHQPENQHGFIGDKMYSMLKLLPNAGYFGAPSEHVFNTDKLVELFSNLPDLPEL